MASSIDIKFLCCKDIHSFTFFKKLSVYALAALAPADSDSDSDSKGRRLQHQKTPVSRDRGSNPEWNHLITFDLEKIADSDLASFFLEIDLLAPSRVFSDKLIGEVRVPLADLLDGADGTVRYQVRNGDGKPNGVLSFSYQVNLKGGKKKVASYPTVEIDLPMAHPKVEFDSPMAHPKVEFDSPMAHPKVEIDSLMARPTVEMGSAMAYPSVEMGSPMAYPAVEMGSPMAYPGAEIGSPPSIYYLAPSPPPVPPALPPGQVAFFPPPSQPEALYAYPPPAGYPTVAPHSGPWVDDTCRDRGYGWYFNGWGWR